MTAIALAGITLTVSKSYRTVEDKNQAIIEIEIIADHLVKKRKKFKRYEICYKNPLTICGFRVKLPFVRQRSFTLHIFECLCLDSTIFQIPQILLGITLNPRFWSNFEWFSVVAIR